MYAALARESTSKNEASDWDTIAFTPSSSLDSALHLLYYSEIRNTLLSYHTSQALFHIMVNSSKALC